jgi:hypothetical protein
MPQVKLKLGREFVKRAQENFGRELVNERVVDKLDPSPPSGRLVEDYMVRIAEEHNIVYKPLEVMTTRPLLTTVYTLLTTRHPHML